MTKKFLISEQERKHILSLYLNKGIILEQSTQKGNYYYSPSFGQNGAIVVSMSNNRLTHIEFEPNSDTVINQEQINGNHQEFVVNVLNGEITNEQFKNNESLVKQFGGFVMVNKEQRPTKTNGIQLLMISFDKNKSTDIPTGVPALCTTEILIGDITQMVKGGSRRERTETPTINYDNYYIPKNRREWKVIKDNLTTETNLEWKNIRRGGYGVYLKPNWGDSFVPKKEVIAPIEVSLNLSNPFEFNSTILSGDGNEKFLEFITKIKDVEEMYGTEIFNKYINFLRRQRGIKVTTSSSIDQDPNQVVVYDQTNSVQGCEGQKRRRDYNKCLSEKRAQAIINLINEQLPELSGVFVVDALGETDQFDVGKKWPEYTNSNDTKNNRILKIKLPRFVFS